MEAVIGFPVRGWPIERMVEASPRTAPGHHVIVMRNGRAHVRTYKRVVSTGVPFHQAVTDIVRLRETEREMRELLEIMEARGWMW